MRESIHFYAEVKGNEILVHNKDSPEIIRINKKNSTEDDLRDILSFLENKEDKRASRVIKSNIRK